MGRPTTRHAATCKFKTAECHTCGKIGHIKPVCFSVKKPSQPPKKTTRGNVCHVQDQDQEDAYIMYHTPSGKSSRLNPYTTTLEVEGKQLQMEIDTGASLSLISESTREKLWLNKRLLPTTAKLRTYSGQAVTLLLLKPLVWLHRQSLPLSPRLYPLAVNPLESGVLGSTLSRRTSK